MDADSGVRTEDADSRASLGKLAEVGVVKDGSFGLVAGIVKRWRRVVVVVISKRREGG